MTAAGSGSVLDLAAMDWKSWLTSRGLDDPDAMTAYTVADIIAGRGAELSGSRVYCAITIEGRPDYVGQTRRPLALRITEHVKSGNAREWAWVVSVTAASLTPSQVDDLERSAHLWMVPLSRRRSRKTPSVW